MEEATLKGYLRQEEKKGNLVKIMTPVKREYEIAAVLNKIRNKIVLFENVEGSSFKVVGNVCGERRRLLEAIGTTEEEYHNYIYNAMENPIPCEIVNRPYFKVEENISVADLPITKHYESEKNYYITSGIVIARDKEKGFQNASIHRLMLLDKETFAIRIVPRHLYAMLQEAKKRKEVLNIAICIGAHPAACLAAGLSPKYGIDHIHVANKMLKGKLHQFKCENNTLALSESEIILEGYIDPFEEVDEGPFTDLTGTVDVIRKQPVVHINKVYASKESLYQDILPASDEHFLLMGLGREVMIRKYVENVVPYVRKVRLTRGGCGWLIAIASIRKLREGDGKNAILACFAAHPSLKIAIVVDEDIDPDDPDQVQYALATRLNPSKGVIIIQEATVSTLDPASEQDIGLGSKLGIDATVSYRKPLEKFKKSKIPVSEERLKEILKDAGLAEF